MHSLLFGLAPAEVYKATAIARGAGELLPHRFTLPLRYRKEVYFLLHCLWVAPSYR